MDMYAAAVAKMALQKPHRRHPATKAAGGCKRFEMAMQHMMPGGVQARSSSLQLLTVCGWGPASTRSSSACDDALCSHAQDLRRGSDGTLKPLVAVRPLQDTSELPRPFAAANARGQHDESDHLYPTHRSDNLGRTTVYNPLCQQVLSVRPSPIVSAHTHTDWCVLYY